jgi:hypothetical protein
MPNTVYFRLQRSVILIGFEYTVYSVVFHFDDLIPHHVNYSSPSIFGAQTAAAVRRVYKRYFKTSKPLLVFPLRSVAH